jgi:hypothetical protein
MILFISYIYIIYFKNTFDIFLRFSKYFPKNSLKTYQSHTFKRKRKIRALSSKSKIVQNMQFLTLKVFSAREKRTKKMSKFDWPKKLLKTKIHASSLSPLEIYIIYRYQR